MKPFFALQTIEKMRPKTFDKSKVYLIRIAPYATVQTLKLPYNLITLEKKRKWVKIDGQKAAILDAYTERGYKKQEAYFKRSRYTRPLCDIAHNPAEAKEIERLYEIDARQAMPGSVERPHSHNGIGIDEYTDSGKKAKKALERLTRMTAAPVYVTDDLYADETQQWAKPEATDPNSGYPASVSEPVESDIVPNDPESAPYTLTDLARKLGVAEPDQPAPDDNSTKPARPTRPEKKS
jgi:hypothetical protein